MKNLVAASLLALLMVPASGLNLPVASTFPVNVDTVSGNIGSGSGSGSSIGGARATGTGRNPSATPTLGNTGGQQSLGNFLAAYALAVDSKNETAIAALFSSDAVATYTAPDQTITGNTAIAQHDLYAFSGVNTFHNTVPMKVEYIGGGDKADTVTYFTATIFGKDCYAGQIVTAYGQYQDTLAFNDGKWSIVKRAQTYANPANPYIGNIAIVLGPACNVTSSH